MNLLLAFITLSLSFAVSAKTIKLAEYQVERGLSVYRTQFNVNKSLNRAWVEITYSDDSYGDTHYTDEKVKVPGLAYDGALNGVIYQAENEMIVCGTFYNQRWTIDLGMSFAPTGRCEIESKTITKDIDDGFYVRKVEFVVVELIVE